MSEKEDRQIAATVIRATAIGLRASAEITPDPMAKGIMLGSAAATDLLAMLIENVGVSKAQDIMKELNEHPATPITDAELDADVAAVKREFGIDATPTDPPPPNPYDPE